MHRAFKLGLLALVALLPVGACSLDNPASETTIRGESVDSFILDPFTVEVMPVLLRDCGFQACHGSQERFFRVWGPGRTRYVISPVCDDRFDVGKTLCDDGVAVPPCNWDRLNGSERDYSLQFARSMVDLKNPEDSLLLRKPLAVERGGADHEGVDKYGRNVYRTPDDEGYRTLSRWVYGYAEQQDRKSSPGAVTPSVPVTPSAAGAAAPPTVP
jgi:hypothetical protein